MTIYLEQGFTSAEIIEAIDGDILSYIAAYQAPTVELEGKTKEEIKQIKQTSGKYFLSGELKGSRRNGENLLTRDAITIDYDFDNKDGDAYKIGHEELLEEVAGRLEKYNYVYYPSFSADSQKVRYHLVIPVDRPLTEKEYQVTFAAIVAAIGVPTDSAMLNWVQPFGLPVATDKNKGLPRILQNDKETYKTRDRGQLEAFHNNGGIERFKRGGLVLNQNPATQTNEVRHTSIASQDLTDDVALAMFADYVEKDRDNLLDYMNAFSAISVLAKAAKEGVITYDTAGTCCEMLALGNAQWEKENHAKLAREYDKATQRTPYSFVDKFVIAVGNARKYEQYLQLGAGDDQAAALTVANIDYEKDTINSFDRATLSRLTVEQKAKLYQNTSPLAQIAALKESIKASTATKAIPTGFRELDKALDGGLYAGLYFIGAISSLGKTTFLLQLADQVAKQGQDVIIFSLEMSRFEIMTKSLSRLTHIIAKEDGRATYHISDSGGYDVQNARTVREITAVERYNGYTDAYGRTYRPYSEYQKELISRAFDRYEQEYAGRLYIHENNKKRITMKDIEDTVEEHVKLTGNRPLVIVDYLQIIAPDDTHADTRFNVDDAVTRLKVLSTQQNIPVMAISSFNRENYSQKVSMQSFKESGGIEYSSDVLIGLQFARQREIDKENQGRKSNQSAKSLDHDAEKNKTPREIELKILKQRNGVATASIDFYFDPRFNHYEENAKGFNFAAPTSLPADKPTTGKKTSF